jgi:hypothetical protein
MRSRTCERNGPSSRRGLTRGGAAGADRR